MVSSAVIALVVCDPLKTKSVVVFQVNPKICSVACIWKWAEMALTLFIRYVTSA